MGFNVVQCDEECDHTAGIFILHIQPFLMVQLIESEQ